MSLRASVLVNTIRAMERTFQVNNTAISSVAKGRATQRVEVALKHWGWRKFLNFWRVEAQLRLGRSKVWGYPYEWEIDTTNICQLKCPLCHTGLGTVNRQKGVMRYETFTKVIDEIKDYCIWLTLYSWGEPFLNKQIDRFVAYANKANIATIISSNLNKPLTPEMAESIIKAGLDVLIVSMDGTTQEVYEKYRVGGHLNRVQDNVRLLAQKKRELGFETPHMEWQFIVMKQNEHQIEEARAMSKKLGFNSIIFKKVDFPHGESDTEVARRWLPSSRQTVDGGSPFDKPYGENGARCWRLWRSGVVNWDGGYAPCCYLTDAKDDFGNVTDRSIKEIWNNQQYVTARDLFKGKNSTSVHVGCTTCNVYLESKAGQRHLAAVRTGGEGRDAGEARAERGHAGGSGVQEALRRM
ncbi:MAG: radical SAM protein [SAR202 cluster bacterium]|nr:radical SAM protein [SAR202 cluster bacterium]